MGLSGSSAVPVAAPESHPDELSPYDPADAPFWKTDAADEAQIRYAKTGVASKEQTLSVTLGELLQKAALKRGDKFAMMAEPRAKTQLSEEGRPPPPVPRPEWKKWTWSDLYKDSQKAAKAILKLGAVQHDAVAIWGQNSPEWVMCALGAYLSGTMCCGIYPSDLTLQFKVKCEIGNASLVCIDDEDKLSKVESAIDTLPYVKAVVVWAARKKISTPGHPASKIKLERKDGTAVPVLNWSSFLAIGQEEPDTTLSQMSMRIRPGHACCLIFTSGTTGLPKGCLLTHDNLFFQAMLGSLIGMPMMAALPTDEERILSYLPLSHIAGQLLDIISPLVSTALRPGYGTLYFARPTDLKTGALIERIRDVRPTIFLGVPRVWEKIAAELKAFGAKNTGIKKHIAAWAKAQGSYTLSNQQIGGSGEKSLMYDLADKVVLSKIKEKLGLDQVKFVFSGAAPIQMETLEYFGSLGLNINEGYGMSESTASTTMTTNEIRCWGSVGFALQGCEVRVFRPGTHEECARISDVNVDVVEPGCEGELCYRGRHIMMGYMSNPKLGESFCKEVERLNRDAIDDLGWLHSGDLGVKDARGLFRVTGRIKDLIIGAGGENIAPVPIENAIIRYASGVLSNCVVLGDKQRFNVCLVTLNCEGATGEVPGTNVLQGPAKALVPGIGTVQAALANKKFIQFIQEAIVTTNSDGMACPSHTSRVTKFCILPHDFSVQTGELTATLKVKRNEIAKIYAFMLSRMYASTESDGMYVKYEEAPPPVQGAESSSSSKSSFKGSSKASVTSQVLDG